MARYAEKEAPLLERIIMQEGLERTKAEDWARDEITRLREELAAVTERMSKLDFERTATELERDALREENARLRNDLKNAIFSDLDYTKEIERQDVLLREENARLREAVAPFVDAGNFKVFINTASTEEECFVSINVKERDLRRARAAIREGGKE